MGDEKRKQEKHIVQYNKKKKRRYSDVISTSINEFYMQENFKKSLCSSFSTKCSINFDNGARLLSEPFSCCVLPEFLNSREYLIKLKEELCKMKMHRKSNDLFQFKQSKDLDSVSLPHVKLLRKILYEDCLTWMKEITNIPLTDTVDMTCSMYSNTDVLLCHDDELEGRRIAFIFYLVPEWEKKDGGSLDLFNSENGQPKNISKSLFPVWNNFVFFEVSPVSYHQVAEVLTDKLRLSVSGWYHGPPIDYPRNHTRESPLLQSPISYEGDIKQWINPTYLDPAVQIQIRELFETNSETNLPDFLLQEKYSEVAHALNECNTGWKFVGPANKRHYEELSVMSDIIEECLHVFQSEAMCLILSNLTGLAFHEMAVVDSSDSSDSGDSSDESTNDDCGVSSTNTCHSDTRKVATDKNETSQNCSDKCKMLSSVRKWKHGYYTLLHDESWLKKGLTANLYFNCEDWKSDYGGYTAYVAKGEGTELLRVVPQHNSLALVYADKKTTNFVKYINNKVLERNHVCFHDMNVRYFEKMK